MYSLVKPFIDLALLRRAPQDLPESDLLLRLTLGAHLAIGVLYFSMSHPLMQALSAALASTTLLVLLIAAVLISRGLTGRLKRTITAMAGVDVVIGALSLPLTGWLHRTVGADPGAAPSTGDQFVSLLFVTLLLWNLAAAGHVLRHALSAPFAIGIVLALLFLVVTVTVMKLLLPGTV